VIGGPGGTPTARARCRSHLALANRPDSLVSTHWTDLGVASWYDFAVAIAEESAAIGLLPATVRVDSHHHGRVSHPRKRPAYRFWTNGRCLGVLAVPATSLARQPAHRAAGNCGPRPHA